MFDIYSFQNLIFRSRSVIFWIALIVKCQVILKPDLNALVSI